MQVILLERISGLGGIGDEARVRDGYARNFLLPQGKALRANTANRVRFEAERAAIEEKNATGRDKAETRCEALAGAVFVIIRPSGDSGRLYGSVAARDIAAAAKEAGHELDRREIQLDHPIKTIGLHPVSIRLHPEVNTSATANIARSADEAERQAAGEDVVSAALRERGQLLQTEEAEEAESETEMESGDTESEAEESEAESETEMESDEQTAG